MLVEAAEVLRGAVFLLTSPLALAALAGMIAAGWGGASWRVLATAAAAGAAMVPWLPVQSYAIAPVLVLVLGVAGAARVLHWRARPVLSTVMSMAAGVVAGLAAEFHWASPREALGGVTAVLALGSLALAAVQTLDRRIGNRLFLEWALAVAGAWILAFAALMILHGYREAFKPVAALPRGVAPPDARQGMRLRPTSQPACACVLAVRQHVAGRTITQEQLMRNRAITAGREVS